MPAELRPGLGGKRRSKVVKPNLAKRSKEVDVLGKLDQLGEKEDRGEDEEKPTKDAEEDAEDEEEGKVEEAEEGEGEEPDEEMDGGTDYANQVLPFILLLLFPSTSTMARVTRRGMRMRRAACTEEGESTEFRLLWTEFP